MRSVLRRASEGRTTPWMPFKSSSRFVHATPIFATAYLDNFNQNNVAQNYLADAGGAGPARSLAFTVPGGSDFVVVFSRFTTGSVALNYSFNVIGLPGCNACPPKIINGDVNNGSTDYLTHRDLSNGRLNRDGVNSACGTNKTAPAVLDTATDFQFDAYNFVNSSSSPACISVALSNQSA